VRVSGPILPVGVCAPVSLIVSHPGHELRVYGWASRVKPILQILTDGSGRGGQGRIDYSRRLAASLGMQPGPVFGDASDRRFYEAMLTGDAEFFIGITEGLAAQIVGSGSRAVVGDAAEGYNPSHDLTRVIIDCAVLLARRISGRDIKNFAFPLSEWETGFTGDGQPQVFTLDTETHAAKIRAARDYLALSHEVAGGVEALGADYFATERLWEVGSLVTEPPNNPMYEAIGAERVRSGAYKEVVRFHRHIGPLRQRLAAHALGRRLEDPRQLQA